VWMPWVSWRRRRRRCSWLTVSIKWRHESRRRLRVIIWITLRCGELCDGMDRRCRGSNRGRWGNGRLAVGLLRPLPFLSRIGCCNTIIGDCAERGVKTYSLWETRSSLVCSYVCTGHA
jgi:hypothetical protein